MKSGKKNKGKRPGKARKKSSGPKPPSPKKVPPVGFVSKAPRPITPVGGGSWTPPEPARMPLDLPPYYPNDLRLRTKVVIGKAHERFPEKSQILDLCCCVVSELTPYFCWAVESKKVQADPALDQMGELLRYILVTNCGTSSESDQLNQRLMRSREYRELANQLVELEAPAGESIAGSGEEELKVAQVGAVTQNTGLAEAQGDKERPSKLAPAARRKSTLKKVQRRRVAVPKDGIRSPNEKRAADVAKFIKELSVLKPQMLSESEYERLREKYPNFLTFKVAENDPDLKLKVQYLQGHPQHIRLAQELAAKLYVKSLNTIKIDWKKCKPKEFRREGCQATVRKQGKRKLRQWGKKGGQARKKTQ